MKYEWEDDINTESLLVGADDALEWAFSGNGHLTVLAVAVVNHDSGEAALIFPDGYKVTDVCELDLVQDILGDAQRVYNEGHQRVFTGFEDESVWSDLVSGMEKNGDGSHA